MIKDIVHTKQIKMGTNIFDFSAIQQSEAGNDCNGPNVCPSIKCHVQKYLCGVSGAGSIHFQFNQYNM